MQKSISTKMLFYLFQVLICSPLGLAVTIQTCLLSRRKASLKELNSIWEMRQSKYYTHQATPQTLAVFWLQKKSAVICGDLIPSSHHPSRADLPTGNLLEMKSSLERVRGFNPELLVCGRGDAIVGAELCSRVLERHIQSVELRIDAEGNLPSGWPKPAETCHWLTPEPAWEFD